MFSNKLIAFLTLPVLLFLYLAWQVDEKYAPWMVPFLLGAALVYILKNEIDWWWHTKRPPVMAPGLVVLLERFSVFYRQLSESDRKKFRERVEMFKMGTDWMPMGWPEDELPEDVKTVLAAQAVTLTLNKESFLFEDFEKVIVYPFPFPTEQHQYAHASELYAPDGCLLFSAEQVMRAFAEPQQWYNVALHEYAKAFIIKEKETRWPVFSDALIWEQLALISGMPKERVTAIIGIAEVEPLPVAIHHFFTFQEAFMRILPEEGGQLQGIFGV